MALKIIRETLCSIKPVKAMKDPKIATKPARAVGSKVLEPPLK